MSTEYYYLISSLPYLALGQRPGLADEQFLDACAQQLSPARFAQLQTVSLVPRGSPCCEADRRWQAWETYRRNRTCAARAAKQQSDATKWQHPEPDAFPADGREINEILAAPDPATRERAMDELRWRRLSDFAVGHDFDFDALVLYRLRLLLASKWHRWSRDAGLETLLSLVQDTVAAAHGAASGVPDDPVEKA